MSNYTVRLHYFIVETIRQYVLDNLLIQIWVLLSIENWFKQTHCVCYSNNIDTVMLHYLTSEKSYTMC